MAKMATRDAYGIALAELVEQNKSIVVLDADLSGSTKSGSAAKVDPNRHKNMGIAEGNMMAVAAGMAANGLTVFASSFAMFAVGRAFEQIRNSICYPNLNVKVCASHAGITVGEDGASHQTVEDISLMRSIPNMIVVSPSDGHSAKKAVKAVAAIQGPCYVRLGRLAVEEVYENDDCPFEIGKGNVLREGKDVVIIANGYMVQQPLLAYDMLKEQGITPTVIDMHTIKPIDKELIVKYASDAKLVVTCEEHSIIGGLGSAVSEVLAQECPTKMAFVGIKDTFGESGTPAELCEKYGLTAKAVVDAVVVGLK